MAFTTIPARTTPTRQDPQAAPARRHPAAPPGNQAVLRRLAAAPVGVQAKLAVGAIDDPLEREADQVADQVMRMPDPAAPLTAAPPELQRKCAACEEEDAASRVQRQATAAAPAAAAAAPAPVHRALHQPGQPLDAATRGFFEPRLGAELGGVRVHQAAEAAAAARSVGARAFTVGHDIVFAEGAFAPHTAAGRALLAHELAHVLQQQGGRQTATKSRPKPR